MKPTLCILTVILHGTLSGQFDPLVDYRSGFSHPDAIAENRICYQKITWQSGEIFQENRFDEYGNKRIITEGGTPYYHFNFYDDEGRIMAYHYFKNETHYESATFTYDGSGRLIGKNRQYRDLWGISVDREEIRYGYNKEGKLKTIEEYHNDEIRHISGLSYDGDNLSVIEKTKSSGFVSQRERFDNGKLVKTEYFDELNESEKPSETYEYNRDGLLVKKIERGTQGNITKVSSFEHDMNRLCTGYSYTYNANQDVMNQIISNEACESNTTITVHISPLLAGEFLFKNMVFNTARKTITVDASGITTFSAYIPETEFYVLVFPGAEIPVLLTPGTDITLHVTQESITCPGNKDNELLIEMIKMVQNISSLTGKESLQKEISGYIEKQVREHPSFYGHFYFGNFFDLENHLETYNLYLDSLLEKYPANFKTRELQTALSGR